MSKLFAGLGRGIRRGPFAVLLALIMAGSLGASVVAGLGPDTAAPAVAESAQEGASGSEAGEGEALCLTADEAAAAPESAQEAERRYEAHVDQGWRLLAAQKPQEAQAEFSLALQAKPGALEPQQGLRLLEQAAASAGSVQQAPAAVAQPQALASSGAICHIVQRGDTLFSLARRFGTTVAAIQAANGLRGSKILVGQRLIIPVCVGVCPQVCVPVCPAPVPVSCIPVCPTPIPVCPAPLPPVCVPVRPTPVPTVCVPVRPDPCVPLCRPVVRVHVVRRGDDIFRLALHFDVSVALLMKVNGLQTTKLKVGQSLIIPDP